MLRIITIKSVDCKKEEYEYSKGFDFSKKYKGISYRYTIEDIDGNNYILGRAGKKISLLASGNQIGFFEKVCANGEKRIRQDGVRFDDKYAEYVFTKTQALKYRDALIKKAKIRIEEENEEINRLNQY